MKLQTTITIPKAGNLIDYDAKVLLLGSCFSQNIGQKLEYYKFQNLINPFGILFHPLAIESLIQRACADRVFTSEDIFFHNERWQSFEVHSELSQLDKDNFLKQMNLQLKLFRDYLFEASHIILTFGTSFVYRHLESDAIVANCHKVPQNAFQKQLLTVNESQQSISNIIRLISEVNKKATIIGTVSPVRHIKDGIVENNRSKSQLVVSVMNVSEEKQLNYFPSFEIMMDQLRDYRFYKEDLIHPNETAIAIIWEKFIDAWVNPSTEALRVRIEKIQQGLSHRPFNAETASHKLFLKDLQSKIELLKTELPHLKF